MPLAIIAKPDGRMVAVFFEYRGKSGLQKTECQITSGEGDLRESATENIPPAFKLVRVKRCGKSAPRFW